ncbi:hypothetical protein AURDEDRAFT_112601, partial [Auricularia subglabra TFB-10046 SS5]
MGLWKICPSLSRYPSSSRVVRGPPSPNHPLPVPLLPVDTVVRSFLGIQARSNTRSCPAVQHVCCPRRARLVRLLKHQRHSGFIRSAGRHARRRDACLNATTRVGCFDASYMATPRRSHQAWMRRGAPKEKLPAPLLIVPHSSSIRYVVATFRLLPVFITALSRSSPNSRRG